MDIRCRFCGEPFDAYSLHDAGMTYARASALWRRYGCGLFDHAWDGRELGACKRSGASPVIGMLTDLMGDDIDGLASELEDLAGML